ncbi:MAG: hypothetical protein NVS3B24_01250 [Candidatus Dormibacteria bacterium]
MTRSIHVSRNAALLAVGGIAVGAGFGVSSVLAASPSATSATTPVTTTQAPPAPPGIEHRGGKHGRGGGGTITGISGTSLTLRTEPGSETVTTDGSTTYMKEHQVIHFSDLHVGDVVHVKGTPATGSTPAAATVAATTVTVVEPSLGGRVQSISGDTYNLVGRDGALLTITVSGSTRYYSGGQTSTRAAITPGTHVHAEGKQDSLTHLVADDIVVDPARPAANPGG